MHRRQHRQANRDKRLGGRRGVVCSAVRGGRGGRGRRPSACPGGENDQRDAAGEGERAADEQPDREPEQKRELGPRSMSATTPREPPAFMTTTDQSPGDRSVLDTERVEIDVLDVGVRHPPQVAGDRRLRRDPNKELLCADGGFAADPDVAEPVRSRPNRVRRRRRRAGYASTRRSPSQIARSASSDSRPRAG